MAIGCGTNTPAPVVVPVPEETVPPVENTEWIEDVRTEFVPAADNEPAMIVVHGLPAEQLDDNAQELRTMIRVSLATDDAASELPATLGEYQRDGDVVKFIPEFPFAPGTKYQVDVAAGAVGMGQTIEIPAVALKATTQVTEVFPSTNVVPENLLKFYFHFSAPMSRGESYKHIELLNQSGEPVDLPFLEIDEELWDADQQRLTVLFDPGRIKRELLPRELLGPALEAGKRYTLVVHSTWPDARGAPLVKEFRKSFRVGPPDEVSPDVRTWKLAAPTADQREPLQVTSPEPLDRALFERLLVVVDADGNAVAGQVAIAQQETHWSFIPTDPWPAGDYKLVIDTVLEDRAGNSIARTFEVDLFEKIDRKIERKTVELPFSVRP